jgi:hypothetical protein
MKRQRWVFSARTLGCAATAFAAFLVCAAQSGAATVTDDFSVPFDYSTGAVNGIWNGSWNMANLTSGRFNTTANPGTLTVDDNGQYDADGDDTNGVTGMGWEGGRSSAPLLYTNIPAGQDFTATIKVSAQTNGNWSAAGLIARAANAATPPGVGTDNNDENAITMFDFRTDPGLPNTATTDMKRLQNGAQSADLSININPGDEPLPVILKLERIGGVGYRGWVSTDNGATFQLQSHTIPSSGNPLRDPAVGLQLGPSYMNFGTLAGTTQFDDFTLDTHAPLAAPGAPVITSPDTALTGPVGTVFNESYNGGQTYIQWSVARSGPARPGSSATTPPFNGTLTQTISVGAQGPIIPPADGSGTNFSWNSANWNPGTYTFTLTGLNDWGQSSTRTLTVTLTPEPGSIVLLGLAIGAIVGIGRRRR